jgi:hypothetical protein
MESSKEETGTPSGFMQRNTHCRVWRFARDTVRGNTIDNTIEKDVSSCEFCSYWNNDKNKYAYTNICFLFLIRWQDERSSALAIQAFEELFPINMHHPNLAVAML